VCDGAAGCGEQPVGGETKEASSLQWLYFQSRYEVIDAVKLKTVGFDVEIG
jgi:hypothetical protein